MPATADEAAREPRTAASSGNVEKGRPVSWPALGSALPILISLLALAVSIFAYLDQHAADDAAAISQQQEYASKVTFWVIGESSGKILRIQNSSSEPITNVSVIVVSSESANQIPVSIGTMPPCTIGSWRIGGAISVQSLGNAGGVDFGPSGVETPPPVVGITTAGVLNSSQASLLTAIEFTDADVLTWQRLVSGEIIKESTPLSQSSLSDPVGSYQKAPAAACS